jgi:hypothetical protein
VARVPRVGKIDGKVSNHWKISSAGIDGSGRELYDTENDRAEMNSLRGHRHRI